jgi:hypothetical protein
LIGASPGLLEAANTDIAAFVAAFTDDCHGPLPRDAPTPAGRRSSDVNAA